MCETRWNIPAQHDTTVLSCVVVVDVEITLGRKEKKKYWCGSTSSAIVHPPFLVSSFFFPWYLAVHIKIKASVLCQSGQHVIEKADACINVGDPTAIETDFHLHWGIVQLLSLSPSLSLSLSLSFYPFYTHLFHFNYHLHPLYALTVIFVSEVSRCTVPLRAIFCAEAFLVSNCKIAFPFICIHHTRLDQLLPTPYMHTCIHARIYIYAYILARTHIHANIERTNVSKASWSWWIIERIYFLSPVIPT